MRTEVTLAEAMHILRGKLKWILLSGVLAAAVMASFTAFFVAPTYSTNTTMYIYTSQTSQTPGSITNSELLAAESMARTCREILLSNCVLSQVCDVVSGDEITKLTTEELMDMIHISTISDTQLLKIQVVAHDPVQAKLIADAFSSIGPAEILRITKAGGVEIVDHARLPDGADDPHLADFRAGMQALYDHPFGSSSAGYFHNIWLDVGRMAGIIPVVLLFCYHIRISAHGLWIFADRQTDQPTRYLTLLVYCGVLLNFLVEPVLEGIPNFFLAFCIINGLVDSYRFFRKTHVAIRQHKNWQA